MSNNSNNNQPPEPDVFITSFRGNVIVRGDTWNLFAQTKEPECAKFPLSNRYGWSTHNCSCNKSKTGLVFYPKDRKFKNVVLLVCEDCYKSGKGSTQHERLCDWYYSIYGDSKTIELISGFSLKDTGELGFNSSTYNLHFKYSNGDRQMTPFEQNIIKEVVTKKLLTYQVGDPLSQDPAVYRCPKGHNLELSDGENRKTKGSQLSTNDEFKCDNCGIDFKYGVSWRCLIDNYDKCRLCVSVKH